MARNYAALPHEYIEEFKELTYEEIGRLVSALLHYSATGEDIKPEGNERFLWRRVVTQEDRFQESYDDIAKARSEAARKAANARWAVRGDADACARMPSDASDANTNTDTDTDTKTDTKTKTNTLPSIEGELFAPPTAEEVASYAKELGSSVYPERFVDYYASKGWKIGNAPMEDWRAAFRNWAREEQKRSQSPPPSSRPQKPSDALRGCETPVSTPDNLRTLERLERLRQRMKTGTDEETPRGA